MMIYMNIEIKIKGHTLFNATEENKIKSLVKSKDTEIKSFKPGEEIFSPKNKERKSCKKIIFCKSSYRRRQMVGRCKGD